MPFSGCLTEQVDARQMIRKAVEAQNSLDFVHMEVESKADLYALGGQKSTECAYSGDFQHPDRWKLKMWSPAGSSEMVIIGDTVYTRSFGAREWRKEKQKDSLGAKSPAEMLASQYLDSASEVKLVSTNEKGNNVSFNLDMGRYMKAVELEGMNPEAFKGKKAKMQVCLEKSSMRIKEATLSYFGSIPMPEGGTSVPAKIRVEAKIEFSRFNQPIEIEAPSLAR